MHDERQSAAGIEPCEAAAMGERNAAAGSSQTTPGWDARPGHQSSGIDRNASMAPDPSSARVHEIRPIDACSIHNIHNRDGVSFTGMPDKQDRRSPWLVAGALVAACGLGWAGGLNSHRLFKFDMVSRSLPQQAKSSPQQVGSALPAREPERKSVATIDGAVRNATSEAGSPAPTPPKLSAATTSAPGRAYKPSVGAGQSSAAPLTAPLAAASPVEQTARPLSGAGSTQREAMVKPAPETRPTTIEGWTVRDVHGDTAVLEGPGGAWKASRGDTVPGVGRIDSIVRWGSRWIVATSSGLIATP
jgi:hypothetical protein